MSCQLVPHIRHEASKYTWKIGEKLGGTRIKREKTWIKNLSDTRCAESQIQVCRRSVAAWQIAKNAENLLSAHHLSLQGLCSQPRDEESKQQRGSHKYCTSEMLKLKTDYQILGDLGL